MKHKHNAVRTAEAMMRKSRDIRRKLDELSQEDINILLKPRIYLAAKDGKLL